MKIAAIGLVIGGVLFAGLASPATAQGTQESQLLAITEIFVKPGMRPEFEAARKQVVQRWEDNDFSFPGQMSVNEEGVYREVSFRGNWDGFARRQQENQALPGEFPGGGGAVDHIRGSILRTRPDLSYFPDNVRVPGNEAGFIGYVFLYLKPGTGAEVAELLRQGNELRRRHNIRDAVIVTSSVVGYDAPMLLLRFHARDVNDYYTQTARNAGMMGEEFANIVRQVAGHTRYIETSNNVQRRDLSYQPEN